MVDELIWSCVYDYPMGTENPFALVSPKSWRVGMKEESQPCVGGAPCDVRCALLPVRSNDTPYTRNETSTEFFEKATEE